MKKSSQKRKKSNLKLNKQKVKTMKTYNYKSVLIARKKRTNPEDFDHRPCFLSFFGSNDPHLNAEGPKEVLEFD